MNMVIQMVHAVFPGAVTLRAVPELHIGIVFFCLAADTAAMKRYIINDFSTGSDRSSSSPARLHFLKILFPSASVFNLIK